MARKTSTKFLKDEVLDRLARMNLELLSELWITRDRLAVVEAVLERNEFLKPGEIDGYMPDADTKDRIETLRELMIRNVIGAAEKNDHTVESLKELGRQMRSVRGG